MDEDQKAEWLAHEPANRQEATDAINGAINELTAAVAAISTTDIQLEDWEACAANVKAARESLGRGSRFYH